jgi:predicted DNA binding protein
MHKGKYNYLYYRCKGRDKGRCDFRNVRADVLDRNVWTEFVKMLSNPQRVEEMILKQNFIVDKNLEEKKAEHQKAGKDLERAKEAIERTKKQYRWGHLTNKEYQAEMANLQRILSQAEERTKNLGRIIKRPKDVHEAVTKSTKYLANELKEVETVKEIRQILKDKGKTRFKRRLRFPELSNDPEYSKLYKKLQSDRDMMDRLELADGDVEILIFQQKRAMLQKFIDPAEDKGIRVYSANKFDLFFYVHLNLFDNLGDE